MDFGASIFFTEYSISPAELAVAVEEHGFDSLWVAEHSHIAVVQRFNVPIGGELERQYYEVMDPFVTLSAAAVVTKRLKLATEMAIEVGRDPKSLSDLGRCPRGSRPSERVPRSRHADECQSAAGQGGRNPAGIGPLERN
jgi:hypothetical protein